MKVHQEKREAIIRTGQERYSIRSKLEEINAKRVEDVLSLVEQWTHYLRENIIVRIEGMQNGLVEIHSNCGRSLPEKIEDTKYSLQEELLDAKKDLRVEFDFRIQRTQVEIDTTRTVVDSTQRGLEAKLSEVEAQAAQSWRRYRKMPLE